MKSKANRLAWIAGTRGEILHLAPLHHALDREKAPIDSRFFFTGEHGMAAFQALDYAGLRPDESSELRHPAEDPSHRLTGLLAEVEGLVRRARASHLVFSGFGPTAAAAALICHSRSIKGMWIRPADRLGIIPRLRYERGIERVIRSLEEDVTVVQAGRDEVDQAEARESDEEGPWTPTAPPIGAIENRNRPMVMIAVGRALWGMEGLFGPIVSACARWARGAPETDWLIMRTLAARFEGPLRSLPDRPGNLIDSPPLPYPEYLEALLSASAVLTDSAMIGSECDALGIPCATVADVGASSIQGKPTNFEIGVNELQQDALAEFLNKWTTQAPERVAPQVHYWSPSREAHDSLREWFDRGASLKSI